MVKGCNFLGGGGQKLAKACGIVSGRIIVHQEKNRENRTQLDESVECASGHDLLLFYNILHLLFLPPGKTPGLISSNNFI